MQNEFRHLENPMNELMDLNIRTFQNLQYMNPTKTMKLQKPGEFLEHNVDLMIRNSHQVLDYWQDMFLIMDHWLNKSTNELRKSYERARDKQDEILERSHTHEERNSHNGSSRLKSKSAKSSAQSSSRRKKAGSQGRSQSETRESTENHSRAHHASGE
jgi:hypothetical protein